ncbi:MAG: TonB family protein [Candidatus Sulfotelmatobacter sp.]
MASKPQLQGWDQPTRRRRARFSLRAPLDVTVLRSGIPDTLPGRSVDLGEGGVAAVLAGELLPGESVGVEIQLPAVADPLRTRALVRHHDKLRSGMEFVGLTTQQQAAIRDWVEAAGAGKERTEIAIAKQSAAKGDVGVSGKDAVRDGESRENFNGAQPPASGSQPGDSDSQPARPRRRRRGRGWAVLLLSAAILVSVLWWHWNREWEELEDGLRNNRASASIHPEANISADVMEKRITHRVEPEYPAAARPLKLQGAIVLDVVVGSDGRVIDLHAQNGPDVLARAAVDALRWWRFEPYLIDGKPAVVETTVAVDFKP